VDFAYQKKQRSLIFVDFAQMKSCGITFAHRYEQKP